MPKLVQIADAPEIKTNTVVLDRFLGVDLSSSVVNVDRRRSPDAPNMMPDADGYPAKRPGYRAVAQLEGSVHGAYALKTPEAEKQLVHAGTKLYLLEKRVVEEGQDAGLLSEEVGTVLYEGMADGPSCAVQLKGKLWILDGKTYLYYDGEKAGPVSSIATVPLITIAKGPKKDTGATSYKPINLLTGRRTDSFLGTAEDADYYLSFGDLTSEAVRVETLGEDGVWTVMESGYTVDTALGKVHFDTAPGKSPVEGEDNVRISYEVEGKAEKVNVCTLAILYGVNGALDRVFMTGAPGERNLDRWSEFEDPAYIGDTSYGTLGSDASPIIGYSVLAGQLVTHKKNEENGRNAFVRMGSLDGEGNAQFLLTGVIQGDGAVAPRSFGSVASEPLFLTRRGICAVASADVTGEKYAQNRSFYLNGALKKETGLEDACAVVWERFYVLSAPDSGRLYLLDTEQKVYESKAPQSAYQMEGFVWEGIGAKCLWVQGTELRFGTADGKVKAFWKGGQSSHYNDNDEVEKYRIGEGGEKTWLGRAVKARWTTPLMNLDIWANLKTVTGVWVVGQPHSRSGGEITYATDKLYEKLVRSYNIDIFDWNDIDFNRWTFNTLDRPMIVNARKKAKKIKLFQVRVENGRPGEPFGIFAIHINYRVGSKVKR